MKTHQTVKLNRLQSDLKVAHYPPQPSAAVMRIMLNSVFGPRKSSVAAAKKKEEKKPHQLGGARLATYGIHSDYICIYPWDFLKAPLIFPAAIKSVIALRESLSLRPSIHPTITSPPLVWASLPGNNSLFCMDKLFPSSESNTGVPGVCVCVCECCPLYKYCAHVNISYSHF